MSSIQTLIPDIYASLKSKPGGFSNELITSLSNDLAVRLNTQFGHRPQEPRLRLSQMGPRCPRALWYSVHNPELAEVLPPWAEVKYAFGHIIEALAITLAKAAGHEVTGEQDELNVEGVLGHRDCVIDGCVVDVKSSSSYGFRKFQDGSIKTDDSFGYLDQLDGYLVGSLEDPLVKVKDKGYLFVIDKQLGHMVLYEHELRERAIRARIREYKEIIGLTVPPPCNCGTEPFQKSGNIKLDTKASYNMYKFLCFPNLRTFIYERGPVYLTEVRELPKVIEIDKVGKPVYH